MPGLKTLSAAALLALLCLPADESRAREGSWCAYAGGRASYEDCGYYNLRQCLDTVRGLGGSCRPNPRLRYQADPDGYDQPPPRRRRYAPY
jgi:hypothetical protein